MLLGKNRFFVFIRSIATKFAYVQGKSTVVNYLFKTITVFSCIILRGITLNFYPLVSSLLVYVLQPVLMMALGC